jgi:signal peptide peptidase SppA
MSHELTRLSARLFNCPLLVLPDVAETIAENLGDRFAAAGPFRPVNVPGGEPEGPDDDPYTVDGGIATIPVRGELVNRGSWLSSQSGLTSYETLQSALRQAASDPRVTQVLLDMDSPGGEAAGAMETADEVRALSRLKPVTAYVNSLAASAAYAIAAGAKEIVVPPSGTVGSIGVVWLHLDRSQAMKERGVKPTLMTAGAFKADGHPYGPLDPEAKARIQSSIDDTYSLFADSVGRHRPKLGADGARATEAALYMGQKAVDSGLADRVATLGQLLKSRKVAASFTGISPMTESSAHPGEDETAFLETMSRRLGLSYEQLKGDWSKIDYSNALAALKAASFTGISPMTESSAHPGEEVAALASAPTDVQPDAKEAEMAEALAVEAARKETAAATAARIKSILQSDGAKAFPKLAARLAYESDMPAEQAAAQLADALADRPAAAQLSRMDQVPRLAITGDVGDPGPLDQQASTDGMWSSIVHRLNKAAGFVK